MVDTPTPLLFDLPYFDQILARLESHPDSELAEAFQRHVHWGYFAQPESANDSLKGYVVAAEALTERMCAAAGCTDGRAILDIGCGFGGTIAHLNERLSDAQLWGLNVDERQLERARSLVLAERGNTVEFVAGDACAMPLPDRRFDAILAVECAFHFRSRKAFLREARRVARPGTRLVLSDFLLAPDRVADLGHWMKSNAGPELPFYGSNRIPPTRASYEKLGHRSAMPLVAAEDITTQTLPTYPAMRRLYAEAGLEAGVQATNYLEQLAVQGFLTYQILTFEAA